MLLTWLIYFSEIGPPTAQAGFELIMKPRMTLNVRLLLHFPRDGQQVCVAPNLGFAQHQGASQMKRDQPAHPSRFLLTAPCTLAVQAR